MTKRTSRIIIALLIMFNIVTVLQSTRYVERMRDHCELPPSNLNNYQL